MPNLTDAEIAEILARAEAAMPGPWTMVPNAAAWDDEADEEAAWDIPEALTVCRSEGDFYGKADVTFMAHARTDVPRLCRELQALRLALRLIYHDPRVQEYARDARELARAALGEPAERPE